MDADAFVKGLFTAGESKERVYSKGDYLLSEGSVEHQIYLIQSGAVRATCTINGEDQTIRLGYKGSIMTSISSFYSGLPSTLSIEALRKTTVLTVSKQTFLTYVNQSPEHALHHNQLLTALILGQMEREIDLLTEAPHERLGRVLTRSPQLFQEIPLKYIASYLRMTPETLSRIRNS
ncbi:MAG: Crp/Fnr family transcriptional regulator [Saprospiraceae bacterium]|nr:Crp/Fnr family transcriptional regulator [Saprospiraceae bacterium]MBK8636696.1 Crp/Fnr family transcriptional regulator [Saprospiraceae bacterium]MBP7643172.1 Crp/Fnr family transcriptional regulator [Saprospiraceae bacterium]HMS71353.1 Crp/Fnr family transcriptional regulator [Saprospiraceae bacterium]